MRDDVFGVDERARSLGVEYVEVRERHSFDRAIWPQLLTLVRDRQIDLIHGHDYKTNLLAVLLARRTGARAVGTAHGWTGHSPRERWLYYPAERQVLRFMPLVVAVSSDVRDALVRAGARPSAVTVLLNGIDPAAFRRDATRREATRRALGVAPEDAVIGAVGRLEPQKRFDLLIDAFAALRSTHPRARLAIVGDGSLKTSLMDAATRAGVAGAVSFLGHRLDIAALYDAFDLFVQSSDYEGTPNAVLEAMAMETPLVATDAGGTRELARPAVEGLIVPPGDPQALRAAMAAALDDPAAARTRAVAARRRVEDDLSFTERTRRLEALYDRLMNRTSPAAATSDDERPAGVARA